MKKLLLVLFLIVTVASSALVCLGQMNATQAIGIAPYGSYDAGNFDSVDLRSGNLYAHMPLFSLPQLGKVQLSVSLVLNNNGYQNGCFTDSGMYVPQEDDPGVGDSPTETLETSECWFYVYRSGPIGPSLTLDQGFYLDGASYSTLNGDGSEAEVYVSTLHDATGASHIMGYDQNNSNLEHSIDGTGYTFRIGSQVPSPVDTLTTPGGISYTFPNSWQSGVTTISDTDGHSITTVLENAQFAPTLPNTPFVSGSARAQDGDYQNYYHLTDSFVSSGPNFAGLTDTLGRTIPSLTDSPMETDPTSVSMKACPTLGIPGQPLAAAQQWLVPGPNGENVPYYFCYTNISINTDFNSNSGDNSYDTHQSPGSTGSEYFIIGEYYADAVAAGSVIQAVVLPNKTYWGFAYDSAGAPVYLPNDPYGSLDPFSMPKAYGDVKQIINPLGGSTSYSYYPLSSGVGQNALFCVGDQPQGYNYAYTGRAVQSRTVNDARQQGSTWGYLYEATSPNTGSGIKTTVTDPALPSGQASSKTIHHYQDQISGQCNLEEVLTERYDGSNLLQSTSTDSFLYVRNLYTLVPGVAALAQALPASETITTSGMSVTKNYSYSDLFHYVGGQNAFGAGYEQAVVKFAEPTTTSEVTSDGLSRTSVTTYAWQSSPTFLDAGVLDAVLESCVTDGSNGCSSAEAGQGAATEYVYGDGNHPYSITAVLQRLGNAWIPTSSMTYDSIGRPSTKYDGDGNPTTIGYGTDPVTGSPSPFPNQITNALNQVDQYTYDDNTGNLTWHNDKNSMQTNYTFDLAGRPLSVSYPDGGKTLYCYSDLGGAVCPSSAPQPAPFTAYVRQLVHDSIYSPSSTSYDGLGRPWQSTGPDGAVTTTEFDALGRVYTVSNPHFGIPSQTDGSQTFLYDALGRKTMQTQQDGTQLQWCYDGIATAGQTDCLPQSSTAYARVDAVDENGKVKQQFTDGLGRLHQVVEDASTTQLSTIYGYDVLGNLYLCLKPEAVAHRGSDLSPMTRFPGFSHLSILRQV